MYYFFLSPILMEQLTKKTVILRNTVPGNGRKNVAIFTNFLLKTWEIYHFLHMPQILRWMRDHPLSTMLHIEHSICTQMKNKLMFQFFLSLDQQCYYSLFTCAKSKRFWNICHLDTYMIQYSWRVMTRSANRNNCIS